MAKASLFLLFALNLFIILFFWWNGSGTDLLSGGESTILALGRVSGLLAVYFIMMQFMMRGRAVWVESVFGLNNLANIHRLNGYFSLLFILLHPILIVTSYAMLGKVDVITQFIDMVLTYQDVWMAAIAVVLFIIIVFASVYIVRRKLKYETWYYIHIFSYLAVFLAFWHQLKLGTDFADNLFVYYWYFLYAFVFGNVLLFRFLRQGWLYTSHQFRVTSVVPEADQAASVYIGGNNLSSFRIEPGQFLILRFLDGKRWWQAHPFSISSVPPGDYLRLTIKDVGDFTHEITGLKNGTPVLVDGPLGTFTHKAAHKDKFLFIAGGVGITPIRALIEQIAPMKKDMVLLYSNKTQDIIFKKELDELSQKYEFQIHYIITQDPNFKGETGRLDGEKIKKLSPDFKDRDIYLCGPPPMMDAIIKDLTAKGVPHSQLHYEKFSL